MVKAFLKWFDNDPHSENEDYYADLITETHLSQLSDEEFKDFFLQFVREGGKIQTGGHRQLSQLQQSIEDNFEEFRSKVLEPFQPGFDLMEWLEWVDGFKYFGKGVATIYLNRVNKDEYVVVNDKSTKALGQLGFKIPSGKLTKTYEAVKQAEQRLLEKYSSLKNYYRVDALTHFLIGTDEGKVFVDSSNEPDYFDFKGMQAYASKLGAKYNAKDPAAEWYKDTRKKLEHLVYMLNERMDTSLTVNYKERPNKQAGPGKITFREYVLMGFSPDGLYLNGDLFIKLVFYSFDDEPKFNVETDINFSNDKNPFLQKREEILQKTRKEFKVDDKFPQNWDQLIQLILPVVEDQIKYFRKIAGSNPKGPLNRNGMWGMNTILYGPPGTGKTYFTKEIAVQLLDGATPAIREEVNKQYAKLHDEGRIQFVTFHQSTSYEDFVEGIKPIMVSEEEDGDGKVQYKIEDGIFKQMCVLAAYEYIKGQEKEQAATKTLLFGQLFDQLLDQYQQQLEEGREISIPLRTGNSINVTEISSQGNFIVQHQNGQRSYTVSKSRLEKLFNEIDDFEAISNIYSSFRNIIGGSNASAYWAILNQIYLLQEQGASVPDNVPVSYEDKKKAFERINWQQVKPKEQVPKYLLIIDEINRGNIAAILGELITLLEDDKRGGNEESLVVTLPYSKNRFAVPPNLYIIGTMNTADRSVEALDTALRRRFVFREMVPDPGLISPKAMIVGLFNKKEYAKCHWDEEPFESQSRKLYEFIGIEKDEVEKPFWNKPETLGKRDWKESDLVHLQDADFTGIHLDKLLQIINQRIRKLIDKDHMIGHAYFMGIWNADDPLQELRLVFQHKILPLLQEYFYGNFGKIQLVLGKPFVKRDEEDGAEFANEIEYEGEDYHDREVYVISDVTKMDGDEFREAIIKIYSSHG